MIESQTVAVISAMEEELEPLKRRLMVRDQHRVGGMTLSVAEFRGIRVILAVSGIGKANAAACMQYVITTYQPDEVINIGAAGSLDDCYQVGDVVLVTESIYHDVDCTGVGENPHALPRVPRIIPSDVTVARNLDRIAGELGLTCHTGRVATGDAFISDGERRKTIRKGTEAGLVEMETAAFAQIAHLNGIPFVSVRSISDNADGVAEMSFETFLAEISERNAALLAAYLESKAPAAEPVSG
ncbi:adenosylhomocysteine nucleosidase [Melghirimyces profundicolus]|uniref:adenosylhomocysteine nucleosidase n=1 Tax=Melghirimyces profundicolus TaxID=1242148 RepID=A0A2T6B2P5_9BACL|nr:5'-methylthioadenosine/adenosylhomocysteine nucleosidase [Melghirimyces profundicolus]PTX50350.1 adenosylhomocysteine nucleosidase [Melghirimyces profundicolus]